MAIQVVYLFNIFAPLLKNVPKEYLDAMIPEPRLRHNQVICLSLDFHTPPLNNDNLLLFREIAVLLFGGNNHETSTSRIVKYFVEFYRVLMASLPTVEDVAEKNINVYEIDIEDEDVVGELAWRRIGKNENAVKISRFYNHFVYGNKIDNFCKRFRCITCDTVFKCHITSTDILFSTSMESKIPKDNLKLNRL